MQLVASIVKLPALFLLTLLVTLPSLYVFNALLGCRLTLGATARLLVATLVVTLAVSASFGTILGFFTLSTTSYAFMVLLNVGLLGVAGLVGLGFLLRTLRRLALLGAAARLAADTAYESRGPWAAEPSPLGVGTPPPPAASADLLGPANHIFRIWLIINALVGVQMAWLLRPFIGDPNAPFQWFRPRSGNFFLAIYATIESLVR